MRYSTFPPFPNRWPLRFLAASILLLFAAAALMLFGPDLTAADHGGPTVDAVAVTSAPSGGAYAIGETIEVTLTFSEAVNVDTTDGAPRLNIDMDPAHWGTKWANYQDGSGAAELTFTHEVVEPNYSTQGIAVLGDSLELNGGTIRSTAATPEDAHLSHIGLDHDPAHRVDWTPPAAITAVAVSSDPGADFTYSLDDVIRIRLTFDKPVVVDTTDGVPQLSIDMDPADWGEKPTAYAGGSGTAELTFAHTVVEPNYSSQGIAVLENSLELNGGTIRSEAGADAQLAHAGLDHDPTHQVDWQPVSGNRAPVVDRHANNYDWFAGNNNAPRGTLVSKGFHGIFSDPDGDPLTYVVSVPADLAGLVELLHIPEDGSSDARAAESDQSLSVIHRVWFRAEAEADWKAITPALPNPVTITATLTATDPDGLSTSLDGGFSVAWDNHPVPVQAAANGAVLQLTFDQNVRGSPTPGQFTVRAVNGDGSSGTITVTGAAVNEAVVRLKLASAVQEGQTVTLDYAHDDDTPLQQATGGDAHVHDFTGQAVAVSGAEPPANVTVTGVAISSNAGGDGTYALGETIQVTVTFSEAVDVTGAPRLKIDLDPMAWEMHYGFVPGFLLETNADTLDLRHLPGVKFANYHSGSGSNRLTFTHDVVEPNISTDGIAVLGSSLELNGGTIQSASTWVDADLAHPGLAHDLSHKVDWQQSPPGTPSLTGVALASKPRLDADDDGTKETYGDGQTILVDLTWSDTVSWDVSATDAKIVVGLRIGNNLREAELVTGGAPRGAAQTLRFSYTVAAADSDDDGISVTPDSGGALALVRNGATLRDSAGRNAPVAHSGLAADPSHLVDGSVTAPANRPPECSTAETWDQRYAAPLKISYYRDVICTDADGDTLEFSLTSDRPEVSKWIAYDVPTNRLSFQPWGHCDLKDIAPALPNPFVTTVTVTATDTEGASATGQAYFIAHYAGSYGWAHGCPHLVNARVYGEALTLTFDVGLDKDSVPAASDFVVKVDGAAVALADTGAVRVEDKSVILTLAAEVSDSQSLTLSYVPGRNPIRDHPRYEAVHARAFEDYPVVNVTPAIGASVALESAPSEDADNDGVNDTYGLGETISVRATFAEEVHVDTTNGTPRLKIDMDPADWGEKWAAYAGGSGTAELTFTHTVVEPNISTQGIAVLRHSLELNGGTIRTAAGADAVLGHWGLGHDAGHKVDWQLAPPPPPPPPPPPTAPALTGAAASGTAINLTFDKALQAAPAPTPGQFAVRVANSDGSTGTVSVNSVAVDEAVVALTLASALSEGQTVTLDYTHAAASPLQGTKDGSPHAGDFRVQAFDLTLPDTLQVRILANPHSPKLGQAAAMAALISNAPSGETPAYLWEFLASDGAWYAMGRKASSGFMVATMSEEESEHFQEFRVTVTYDAGPSATSPVFGMVWTR